MAPEGDPRMRLNQFLARCGVASRRAAEEVVRAGRVTVNGERVTELAVLVDPERDSVKVDGERVRLPDRRTVFAFYKPKEVVSTLEDPEGRPSLKAFLPKGTKGLFPVGRLDFHSEGLLLLTNDGDLGFRLLHPRFHVPKVYEVKVKGSPAPEALDRLRRGIVLEGRRTLPVEIRRIPSRETRHTWLRVVMMEGRKNQLREMFFRIDHPVIKLKRTAMGPVRLGNLKPGQLRPLSPEEAKALWEAAASPRPLPPPPPRKGPAKAPAGEGKERSPGGKGPGPGRTPAPRKPSRRRKPSASPRTPKERQP
ncbi:MAG: pseudouridine synthase [Acidobacteriota bacterium]